MYDQNAWQGTLHPPHKGEKGTAAVPHTEYLCEA
jgi:hypothetical protein